MIEVEKKFLLGDHDRAALLQDAAPLGTLTFTDIYYDTADYLLTKRDWWLRERDGRFELKIPPTGINRDVEANQYEELAEEAEIKKALNLAAAADAMLREALGPAGFGPFATLTTSREKFKKEGFTIDIDSVDFGFALAEIELMVREKDDIEPAKELIFAFARRHGLAIRPVRGKVIEYLARHSPEHFRILETAWNMEL